MGRERGFTLLEVLVAFAIAAMAIVVLMRSNVSGLGAARTAARYEEAISRARSHMAAIGFGTPLAPGKLEGDDGGGYRWHIEIAPRDSFDPRQAGNAAGDVANRLVLYDVTVRVAWADGATPRQVELNTRRIGNPAAPQ